MSLEFVGCVCCDCVGELGEMVRRTVPIVVGHDSGGGEAAWQERLWEEQARSLFAP